MNGRKLTILALAAALAAAPALANGSRVEFMPIEGGEFMFPADMTADGSTVVLSGLFGGIFFQWTESGGVEDLGSTGCGSGQLSISSDGSMIVANAKNANGKCEAAKYLGNQQWLPMGSEPGALPCGSSVSSAYDTNADTAVGLFWRAQLCKAIGGTWDVVTGTAGPALTSTVPNRPTRGNGITDDGSIVVGWQDAQNGARQAVKWVLGVQEYILNDTGDRVGEAITTNGDGSAIAGTHYHDPRFGGSIGQGWLWREGKGMIPMAVGQVGKQISGNVQSVPVAVSADGNSVVGITRNFSFFEQGGWYWNEQDGFYNLNDLVKGDPAALGWDIQQGSAMSADGTLIGGWGFNPDGTIQGFLIRLGGDDE